MSNPLQSASVDLPISTPRPGWSEQDPRDWWSATCGAIRRVIDTSGVGPERIAGLAISGQMHGATLLDAEGGGLRPCILWNDQRAGEECGEIEALVGRARLLQSVGNPALAGFTAPKLLWVRKHEPDIFDRIATVLLPKDYLIYRLTGTRTTEVSDASGTLLFDVTNRRWSEEMLDALSLSPRLFPPVVGSTDLVGGLSAEAAEATGLNAGTRVVAGGADNACAAVGSGAVAAGQMVISIGTSGTVIAPSATGEVVGDGALHTFCHAVPDLWYRMGVVLSAGGSLRWFRDVLSGEARHNAATTGLDAYEAIMDEAGAAPPGSEGLLFLPYLTGERTPHGDPDARGAFVGLTARHGYDHLARSVVEGVTFALADSVRLMPASDLPEGPIRLTGGGARSALWRQILADVLNARVESVMSESGPALGAAILAGVGTGALHSFAQTLNALEGESTVTEPIPQHVDIYRRYFEVYDSLYPALRFQAQQLSQLAREEAMPHAT
jgi:xylulokinase